MEFLDQIRLLREKSRLEREKIRQNRLMLKEIPNLCGLLAVAGSSGLSGEQSLRAISPFLNEQLSKPFNNAIFSIEKGQSLRKSMQAFESYEYLRPISHMLLESMEAGTSSIPAFDAMGRDALNRIRRNSELAIKRLPVTMLFPLVICILPSFMLLSVIPTLVSGFTEIQF